MQTQRNVSAPYSLRNLAHVRILCCKQFSVKEKRKQSGVCYITGLENQQNAFSTSKQIHREDGLDLKVADLFIRPSVAEGRPL